MTESQPEGSETTRLIKENAFEVEETGQYTQRATSKSFQTSKKEKHRQAKVKATRRRRRFLGKRQIFLKYFFWK